MARDAGSLPKIDEAKVMNAGSMPRIEEPKVEQNDKSEIDH